MEQFAAMKAQLNRNTQQVQNTSQAVVEQQTFDSGVGASAGADPTQAFLADLGDPTKVATPAQLMAWNQYMTQNRNR